MNLPGKTHYPPMSISGVALRQLRYRFGVPADQKRGGPFKQRFYSVAVLSLTQGYTRQVNAWDV